MLISKFGEIFFLFNLKGVLQGWDCVGLLKFKLVMTLKQANTIGILFQNERLKVKSKAKAELNSKWIISYLS